MTRGTKRAARAPSAQPRIEEVLWSTADQLRGHMDAAEYKHVVLGLVFLKYISDAFTTLYDKLKAEEGEETAEDRDEYLAEGVFWVPREARWDTLKDHAREATIGSLVDKAMAALEKENAKQLGGMLPTGYARPSLPHRVIGGLIDEISKYGTGGTVSDNSGDLFSD